MILNYSASDSASGSQLSFLRAGQSQGSCLTSLYFHVIICQTGLSPITPVRGWLGSLSQCPQLGSWWSVFAVDPACRLIGISCTFVLCLNHAWPCESNPQGIHLLSALQEAGSHPSPQQLGRSSGQVTATLLGRPIPESHHPITTVTPHILSFAWLPLTCSSLLSHPIVPVPVPS